MTATPVKTLTLQEFLKLPKIEESPAWEYINGKAIQKPMPQGCHSKLQFTLCEAINQVSAFSKLAYALPELRCTFGGRSVVPDIAVIYWHRIPTTLDGEIADRFEAYPDWTIEILSPGQRLTRVIENILHCLQHGSQLGWLIDPEDKIIVVFRPQQEPIICRSEDPLPILNSVELRLTPDQIFKWLKMRV